MTDLLVHFIGSLLPNGEQTLELIDYEEPAIITSEVDTLLEEAVPAVKFDMKVAEEELVELVNYIEPLETDESKIGMFNRVLVGTFKAMLNLR